MLASLVFASCGAEVDAQRFTASSRAAVKAGVADAERTEVVAILGEAPLPGLCSGSLIAPNVVLTARHCVSELIGSGIVCADEAVNGTTFIATRARDPEPPGSLSVTQVADLNTSTPPPFVAVKEVRAPIGNDTPVCGNDLAILILAQPIPTARLVPLRTSAVTAGEELTAVGFGSDGAQQQSAGVRRVRTGVPVAALGVLRNSAGRVSVTENDFVMAGPCGGDSGGPALDVAGMGVGIMSRGSPTACEQMVYTQVAPHHAWLAAEVRAATADAGIESPPWARSAEPDAGVDAGVDAGAEPETPTIIPGAGETLGPPVGCATGPSAALLLGVLAFLCRRGRA